MATKPRNLYLYLALVCFLGIIAIFIVDGYMGVYDIVYITAGEREQKIEADVWLRSDKFWSVGVNQGARAFFRYEVANRRFSSYATPIQASLWQEKEKVIDLFAADTEVETFGEVSVEWILDSSELEARGFSQGQYTVKIKREGEERSILVHFRTPNPPSPLPIRLAP